MHFIPICWKTFKILLADPPATRIAKHSRKFPAGILVPGILGWLCQVFVLLLQEGFEHMVVTSAIVPFSWTWTSGLSDLQHGQNLKRVNNWVKNTINFGSVLMLSFFIKTLKQRHSHMTHQFHQLAIRTFFLNISWGGKAPLWAPHKLNLPS